MNNIYKKIPLGRVTDLRDKKFGMLTPLYRTENKGRQSAWVCQCDCGNLTVVTSSHLVGGHTQSCGCLRKTKSFKDITGQRFGRLKVVEYDHSDKKGHTFWKCKCDCGNEKIIRKDGLISGAVISCGCYHSEEISKRQLQNLANKKFGYLTPIECIGFDKHHNSLWKCKCDCGNEKIVSHPCLVNGETISCGCIKSKGEQKIADLLKVNNISFIQQKSFDNCRFKDSGLKAKFDFFVENKYIIEFDGIQHFKSGSGWNTSKKLIKTQEHDNFKNNWCKEQQIPLIRIPYSAYDNLIINDLILESSKYKI